MSPEVVVVLRVLADYQADDLKYANIAVGELSFMFVSY